MKIERKILNRINTEIQDIERKLYLYPDKKLTIEYRKRLAKLREQKDEIIVKVIKDGK